MIIRAYEGYNQPFGADLLDMLKTEGEKYLSSLTAPTQQAVQTYIPQTSVTTAQAEPIPATRSLQDSMQASQQPGVAPKISPIMLAIAAYFAYKLFFAKK